MADINNINDDDDNFDIDELCDNYTNDILNEENNLNIAAEQFIDDILYDFKNKLKKSLKNRYNETYLYYWKNIKDKCDDDGDELFKTYNGYKPFDIINKYQKNLGKGQFIKKINDTVNDKFGTEKTKFFIRYKRLRYNDKFVFSSQISKSK